MAAPDLVLLPDEPYPFTAADGPEEFGGHRVVLLPGRLLTWYGPSLATARADLLSLIREGALWRGGEVQVAHAAGRTSTPAGTPARRVDDAVEADELVYADSSHVSSLGFGPRKVALAPVRPDDGVLAPVRGATPAPEHTCCLAPAPGLLAPGEASLTGQWSRRSVQSLPYI